MEGDWITIQEYSELTGLSPDRLLQPTGRHCRGGRFLAFNESVIGMVSLPSLKRYHPSALFSRKG